jgi:hypothetical protein
MKFGLPGDTSYDLLLCSLFYRTFIADRGDDEKQLEAARKQNPFAGVQVPGGYGQPNPYPQYGPPQNYPYGQPMYVPPPLPQASMAGITFDPPPQTR